MLLRIHVNASILMQDVMQRSTHNMCGESRNAQQLWGAAGQSSAGFAENMRQAGTSGGNSARQHQQRYAAARMEEINQQTAHSSMLQAQAPDPVLDRLQQQVVELQTMLSQVQRRI